MPGLATFNLRCNQQLPLRTELDCCQSWPPYSIHISKVPLFGASDDHLWQYTPYINGFGQPYRPTVYDIEIAVELSVTKDIVLFVFPREVGDP
jgi:hypothetical protein